MSERRALDREIHALVEGDISGLEALYRDLHAHPELSGSERRTMEVLARALGERGVDVVTGIGGTGVAGLLANGSGPAVMIRADMDALPIREETGLPYASCEVSQDTQGNRVPVMHACGHDVHMVILAGTARVLSSLRSHWAGQVLFVGQPSEETVSGARSMLADGLFTRFPRPSAAFALHVGPGLPLGTIGSAPGLFSAGAESIDVVIRGVGGHAAHPDQTRDPVVAAAHAILALQTIVSREVPPDDFAVVTVAAVNGGTKHNAIPDEVTLKVNLRYFKPEIRELLLSSVSRILAGTAAMLGTPPGRQPLFCIVESVPPLWNDPDLSVRVMDALSDSFGKEQVRTIAPLTGSEDFAFFGSDDPPVPLCYFRVGIDPEEKRAGEGVPQRLHTGTFAPPALPVIRFGIQAMVLAVFALLEDTG